MPYDRLHITVGNPVKPGSGGSLLKRQPVNMGSIEPVPAGQRRAPSPMYAENALFTRDADEGRNWPPSLDYLVGADAERP
jgi:hypothetical protein